MFWGGWWNSFTRLIFFVDFHAEFTFGKRWEFPAVSKRTGADFNIGVKDINLGQVYAVIKCICFYF